jgi:MFS-type transporter involved in bile tolerance (Atg22 family)
MLAGIARGAISMSNVHLSNAFLYLACKEGGGFGEGENSLRCVDPDVRVRGMKPASFVSNILIAASVLSAIMMPPTGAIIDFTPHRRWVGVVTAVLLAVISGVQIATVEETWFAMAILQAIIFMIYQLQLMTLFAYFPEIAGDYGSEKMIAYSSTWSAGQFTSQAGVNLVVIMCNLKFKLGTVKTAMLCQGLTLFLCLVCLLPAWYIMPDRPPRHTLKKGRSLALAGFQQNWYTFKKIWKNYRNLAWFLFSVFFGESAALAVGNTAVIFLSLSVGLSALQIAVFFEVSLIGVVLGTKAGAFITRKTNPNISLQLAQLGCAAAIIIGCWIVQDVEVKERTYPWGFSIGFFLGWFYPMENVFFSLVVPKNQEAEFAGFYNYASQIGGWLPPLIFTIMVEADITVAWALTATASFFLIAIFCLRLTESWEQILEDSQKLIPNTCSFIESEASEVGDQIDGDKRNIDSTVSGSNYDINTAVGSEKNNIDTTFANTNEC